MAKKTRLFRCINDMGGDPCNWAKEGRRITEDEAVRSMDGDGFCCQGTTESGQTCGKKLEEIKTHKSGFAFSLPKLPPMMVLAIVGGVLVLVLVVWGIWKIIGGDDGKPADITITPNPVVLTVQEGSTEPVTATVTIKNNGKKPADVKAQTLPNDYFTPDPLKIGVDAYRSARITITYQPKPGQPLVPSGTLTVGGKTVQIAVSVDKTKDWKCLLLKMQCELNQGGQQHQENQPCPQWEQECREGQK